MKFTAFGLVVIVLIMTVGFMMFRLALSILLRMVAVVALIIVAAMFWLFFLR